MVVKVQVNCPSPATYLDNPYLCCVHSHSVNTIKWFLTTSNDVCQVCNNVWKHPWQSGLYPIELNYGEQLAVSLGGPACKYHSDEPLTTDALSLGYWRLHRGLSVRLDHACRDDQWWTGLLPQRCSPRQPHLQTKLASLPGQNAGPGPVGQGRPVRGSSEAGQHQCNIWLQGESLLVSPSLIFSQGSLSESRASLVREREILPPGHQVQ